MKTESNRQRIPENKNDGSEKKNEIDILNWLERIFDISHLNTLNTIKIEENKHLPIQRRQTYYVRLFRLT